MSQSPPPSPSLSVVPSSGLDKVYRANAQRMYARRRKEIHRRREECESAGAGGGGGRAKRSLAEAMDEALDDEIQDLRREPRHEKMIGGKYPKLKMRRVGPSSPDTSEDEEEPFTLTCEACGARLFYAQCPCLGFGYDHSDTDEDDTDEDDTENEKENNKPSI